VERDRRFNRQRMGVGRFRSSKDQMILAAIAV
jgi:hypothetical protein